MNIITLTPNPALDISTSVPQLIPGAKLRCANPQYNPGGGGINVSRVIHRLGEQSTAVFPSGGASGQNFRQLLTQEGIKIHPILVNAATRESFAVTETSTNFQYRFGMPGNPLQQGDYRQMLDTMEILLLKPDFLIVSGSLPPGVPDDFYAQIALIAKKTNTRLILDTSGVPLKKALDKGLFLIKPNLNELASLAGKTMISGTEQEKLGMEIVHSGKAEIVVVSLGPRGAMLISKEGIQHAIPPTILPKSTIGAGDSMVAGIAFALSQKKSLKEVLQYGVACGTATTMREGTSLCRVEDIQQILNWMNSKK